MSACRRVTDDQVTEAKATRAERDRRFPRDVFPGHDRWVGDLGEIIFNQWLAEVAPDDYRWLRHANRGEHDFIIYGHEIEMKTTSSPAPWRDTYHCGANKRHVETPTPPGHFFFGAYHESNRTLTLVGGMAFQEFRVAAVFHPEGSQLGRKGKIVTKDEEMYDVQGRQTTPPWPWLDGLR